MMRALQGHPGVEMVTSFGIQLHVAGADAGALKQAIDEVAAHYHLQAENLPPTLEDIFIHTMN